MINMRNKSNWVSKKIVTLSFFVYMLTSCATRAHDLTRALSQGNEAALRGDFSEAVAAYERGLAAVPDSKPGRRNLGIILVKVGDYKRARDLLWEVMPYYERDVDLRYHLGEAYRGLGQLDEAVKMYQDSLVLDQNDMRVIKALSWTYFKQKNFGKSLEIIRDKYAKSPDDLQIKLIVASNYNKLGLFDKALSILKPVEDSGFRVQSKDKVSADSERALLLVATGDAYLGRGNCARAEALFGEVLRHRPFMAQALVGSAKCDLRNAQPERARIKLERSLRAEPEAAEPHLLLSQIYETNQPQRSAFYYKRYMLLSGKNQKVESKSLSR